MPTLINNGIELYYETQGSGEPLVLLSGLATDSQSWLGCLPGLSKDHQTIILDNRGCGRSLPQDTQTSISLMAADVIALLDHLNLEQAHILGNSMGGFIALELATMYPNRVHKLILEATASKNTTENNIRFDNWAQSMEEDDDKLEWYREAFYWLFHHKIFNNPKSLEAKLTFASRYPYQQTASAFRKQLEAVKRFDARERLANISAETLILCGAEDLLFSTDYCQQSLAGIPNSKVVIINNAAHAIHVDNPHAFLTEVGQFLATP